MKKLLIVILTVFTLISCSAEYEGEPFLPFAGEFEAEICLQIEGQSTKIQYSSRDEQVRFLAPQELSGFTLCERDGQIYLSHQELSLPVSKEAGVVLELCREVLAVKDAMEITTKKDGKSVVTVVSADDCKYTFSSEGMPVRVDGVHNGQIFEMLFDSFTVTQK